MERPKMSEARRRANKKWNDANMAVKYDHLHIIIPKGRKEDIEAYTKEASDSVNGLVNDLLREELGMSAEEWKARKEGPEDE